MKAGQGSLFLLEQFLIVGEEGSYLLQNYINTLEVQHEYRKATNQIHIPLNRHYSYFLNARFLSVLFCIDYATFNENNAGNTYVILG
jgi:hypothetical protein